jgi:Ca2+-transporting ATPase
MILTDDNFGTLVHAVELGRRVYAKVVAYIRFQMTQLLALVFLFLAATLLDVNEGVAMTPSMVLFLLFFVTSAGVAIIAVDPGDPDVMNQPPRDTRVTITNRSAVLLWVLYGATLFVAAFVPLVAGPDSPQVSTASASMTMTFVVMGLGTVLNALTNRRDPTSGLAPPVLQAAAIAMVPVVVIVLATELDLLQGALLTQGLTGGQWLAAIGLSLLLPVVVEISKAVRRRRPRPAPVSVARAVAPARATAEAAARG